MSEPPTKCYNIGHAKDYTTIYSLVPNRTIITEVKRLPDRDSVRAGMSIRDLRFSGIIRIDYALREDLTTIGDFVENPAALEALARELTGRRRWYLTREQRQLMTELREAAELLKVAETRYTAETKDKSLFVRPLYLEDRISGHITKIHRIEGIDTIYLGMSLYPLLENIHGLDGKWQKGHPRIGDYVKNPDALVALVRHMTGRYKRTFAVHPWEVSEIKKELPLDSRGIQIMRELIAISAYMQTLEEPKPA